MSVPPSRVRREAVALAVLASLVYVALASSAPRWGDAADLARRAVIDPLAPYGRSYPLQSALTRIADALVRSPAHAATIVTSLLAGCGVGLAYWTCRRRLGCGRAAGLGAAAAWGLNHAYWSAAADGEAYVLLGVFALAACEAVLASREGVDGAWLAGLVAGLAPLHHRAFLLGLPVLLVAPVVLAPAGRRGAAALRVALGTVAGLVPFAVLVLVEAGRAPGGLDGAMVQGVLFGTPRNAELLLDSRRELLGSVAYVARWTAFSFAGLALPVAFWGLGALLRRRTAEAVALLALGLSLLVIPLRFDAVGDRHVFLVAVYPVLVLGVGAGIEEAGRLRRPLGAGLAVLCAVTPPVVFGGLAAGAAGRLLPGLTPQAEAAFLLPARTGDRGSATWAAEAGRALRDGEHVYAEWGAAAALDYARDVAGTVPAVVVIRRMPTADEVRDAGPQGVVVALTPIWSDEDRRVAALPGRASRVAPSCHRLRAAE